ncbi:GNAT family N-acetyltransferase [Halobacillus trueperi]|uniref:GNAT family N-acetyltransferase n=1 Tax=Halobacillus trueperi TaxID=156205 RepID=A0A3D8VI41_9BACI|nr:GNAT family N-acetyltransferase [Halobacillus trueperi]RDY69070.1 GNAT family N-acetyltransferase [Halobacillus trueperi]
MLFENGDLLVRQVVKEDHDVLSKWLSDPSVLEYYEGRDQPFNRSKIENEFISFGDEKTQCLVGYKGMKIGYIQYYELDKKMKGQYGYVDRVVYGMDQFIGEVMYWNKGMGSLLVTSMVDYLFKNKCADRVVMDPQVRNERALRCYEKCGFRKVKLLPSHELHEGEYQDCWLMDIQRGK